MDKLTIKLDNDMHLNFIGEELARAVDLGLCYTYVIYKANNGKFVCQKIDSVIYGDRYEHTIVDNIVGVVDFFGNGKLATKLYREMDNFYGIT